MILTILMMFTLKSMVVGVVLNKVVDLEVEEVAVDPEVAQEVVALHKEGVAAV